MQALLVRAAHRCSLVYTCTNVGTLQRTVAPLLLSARLRRSNHACAWQSRLQAHVTMLLALAVQRVRRARARWVTVRVHVYVCVHSRIDNYQC
jgi:hypothetical protein